MTEVRNGGEGRVFVLTMVGTHDLQWQISDLRSVRLHELAALNSDSNDKRNVQELRELLRELGVPTSEGITLREIAESLQNIALNNPSGFERIKKWLSVPILEAVVAQVLQENCVDNKLRLILFATDQRGSRESPSGHRDDTYAVAELVKTLLMERIASPALDVRVCPVECNPADFTSVMRFMREKRCITTEEVAGAEAVFVGMTGGPPMSYFALLFWAIEATGLERVRPIYVHRPHSQQTSKAVILDSLVNAYLNQKAREFLNKTYSFESFWLLVGEKDVETLAPELRKLWSLSRALQHRLRADMQAALGELRASRLDLTTSPWKESVEWLEQLNLRGKQDLCYRQIWEALWQAKYYAQKGFYIELLARLVLMGNILAEAVIGQILDVWSPADKERQTFTSQKVKEKLKKEMKIEEFPKFNDYVKFLKQGKHVLAYSVLDGQKALRQLRNSAGNHAFVPVGENELKKQLVADLRHWSESRDEDPAEKETTQQKSVARSRDELNEEKSLSELFAEYWKKLEATLEDLARERGWDVPHNACSIETWIESSINLVNTSVG